MKKKALFLDRDGVINIEKKYVFKIKDFEFVEGIFEVLHHFQKEGYVLIIITNQAGIGRGYYTEDDFRIVNDWMLKQFEVNGIFITKVYYCPYHPEFGLGSYKKNAFCRKPKPGMILDAKKEFNLDLSKSILIGDKESDIEAGVGAGINTNVLIVSSNKQNLQESRASIVINNIKDLIKIFPSIL
ncbi:HAD family hydrolase [Cytobacillus oceanisediminis]|uniref:D-glycero-alpha-D-manno-heptose-1,7-bisphosphate 7-phosphatase n=1 Tax=Cytobacillus oceanisediminis TaxID=665099 RepID=UPI001D14D333|nr:HAD family hydrolase [Cytobacillus oceanisediminis]MCC3646347.1 HAD family hydrolase [Cytobacillus oceanisediminis]